MDKKISIADLASRLSQQNHLPLEQCNEFISRFFEVLENGLMRENMVKVKGFGTFKIVQVAERESVDVNTGERILIQGHSKMSFTPDPELRDKVNKPFAVFDPINLNEGVDEAEMAYVPEETVETENDDEEIEPRPVMAPLLEPTDNEEKPIPPSETESEEFSSDEIVAEVPASEPEASEEHMEVLAAEPVETEEQTEEQDQMPESEPEVEASPVYNIQENPVPQGSTIAQSPNTEHLYTHVHHHHHRSREKKNKFQWGYLLYALLTIVLMAASYYAGYYQLLSPFITTTPSIQDEEMVVEVLKGPEAGVQSEGPATVSPDGPASEQQSTPEEPSVEDQYPQVPGGACLIVGVQGIHKMAIGDNLYKIARNEYGDKDYATYIIVLNQFKDPDNIPLGYEVKLPKLRPNE